MLFPTLGSSSLPVVVAQPDERHANRTLEQLLCWSGMADTELTTSGSNEVLVVASKYSYTSDLRVLTSIL